MYTTCVRHDSFPPSCYASQNKPSGTGKQKERVSVRGRWHWVCCPGTPPPPCHQSWGVDTTRQEPAPCQSSPSAPPRSSSSGAKGCRGSSSSLPARNDHTKAHLLKSKLWNAQIAVEAWCRIPTRMGPRRAKNGSHTTGVSDTNHSQGWS